MNSEAKTRDETSDQLGRRALFGFSITFILSRVLVFLIMSRRIPNLFLFLQGTHVHQALTFLGHHAYWAE
jgi:hypothetical protein